MVSKHNWFIVILVAICLLPATAMSVDFELISQSDFGNIGNAASGEPAISADGRFVVFTSDASNLVDNDPGSWYWQTDPDVFLFDRESGTIQNASRALNFAGYWFLKTVCQNPTIDARGDLAAFECFSGYHFAHGMQFDIYLYNRLDDSLAQVTWGLAGRKANGGSHHAKLSADGRALVFTSTASNLITNDSDQLADVYLYETQNSSLELVSVNAAGEKGNGASGDATLSADGQIVAFTSSASNLVASDTNQVADIFIRHRQSGVLQRYSAPDNTDCSDPTLSGAGTLLAFSAAGADGRQNIYLVTEQGDVQKVVEGGSSVLSNDGHFLAYIAAVPGAQGDVRGAYRRDLVSGQTELVSAASPEDTAEGVVSALAMSGHGAELVFGSTAINLVADDDNDVSDVFLAVAAADTTPPTVNLTLSTNLLWPPNKKFVPVQVDGLATDDNQLAKVEITVSDEYGSMLNQIVPGFGSTIWLEAWRDGDDMDGRWYTVIVTASDVAGNQSEKTATVLVPHDMRDKK